MCLLIRPLLSCLPFPECQLSNNVTNCGAPSDSCFSFLHTLKVPSPSWQYKLNVLRVRVHSSTPGQAQSATCLQPSATWINGMTRQNHSLLLCPYKHTAENQTEGRRRHNGLLWCLIFSSPCLRRHLMWLQLLRQTCHLSWELLHLSQADYSKHRLQAGSSFLFCSSCLLLLKGCRLVRSYSDQMKVTAMIQMYLENSDLKS